MSTDWAYPEPIIESNRVRFGCNERDEGSKRQGELEHRMGWLRILLQPY